MLIVPTTIPTVNPFTGATLHGGSKRLTLELAPEHIKGRLHDLVKRLVRARKEGPAPMHRVEELSSEVWMSSVHVDAYITKLEQGIQQIKDLQALAWTNVQELLDPLWRVDNELGPVYEELAQVKGELDLIRRAGQECPVTERLDRIQRVQERLGDLEERHVEDGKFYPSMKWKADGLGIPSGQAILATLLSKCRNYAHSLLQVCESRTVDVRLLGLQRELEEWSSLLDTWPAAPMSPTDLDDLKRIQEKLDDLQGTFQDANQDDLPGLDILREEVERAYETIRTILERNEELAQAAKETEQQQELNWRKELIAQIKDIQLSLLGYLLGTRTHEANITPNAIKYYRERLDVGFSVMKAHLHGSTVPEGEETLTELAIALGHCYAYLGKLTAEYDDTMDPSLSGTFLELEEINQQLRAHPNHQHAGMGSVAEREQRERARRVGAPQPPPRPETRAEERERHLVYEREVKRLLALLARVQEADYSTPGLHRVEFLLHENLCLAMQ